MNERTQLLRPQQYSFLRVEVRAGAPVAIIENTQAFRQNRETAYNSASVESTIATLEAELAKHPDGEGIRDHLSAMQHAARSMGLNLNK